MARLTASALRQFTQTTRLHGRQTTGLTRPMPGTATRPPPARHEGHRKEVHTAQIEAREVFFV